MTETPLARQTILAVLPAGEDSTSLRTILAQSNWKVRLARTFRDARRALRTLPGVVISERELPDGQRWQDLLLELQKMPCPPPLIVADRLADDRLWGEVLNLGAHDLLVKPFDAKEVVHVISAAFRRAENEQRAALPRIKPLGYATAAGSSTTRASTG